MDHKLRGRASRAPALEKREPVRKIGAHSLLQCYGAPSPDAPTKVGARALTEQLDSGVSQGTAGTGASLPHFAEVQRLLGRHDSSGIQSSASGAFMALAASSSTNSPAEDVGVASSGLATTQIASASGASLPDDALGQPEHAFGTDFAADANFAAGVAGYAEEVPYRREMERSFGEDFSDVRAYRGRVQPMAELGARAATRGEEVVFASSDPDPHLVAHELTHVVQGRRDGSGVHGSGVVGAAGSPAEVEADAVADRVAVGEAVTVREVSSAGIHLDPEGDDEHPVNPRDVIQYLQGKLSSIRIRGRRGPIPIHYDEASFTFTIGEEAEAIKFAIRMVPDGKKQMRVEKIEIENVAEAPTLLIWKYGHIERYRILAIEEALIEVYSTLRPSSEPGGARLAGDRSRRESGPATHDGPPVASAGADKAATSSSILEFLEALNGSDNRADIRLAKNFQEFQEEYASLSNNVPRSVERLLAAGARFFDRAPENAELKRLRQRLEADADLSNRYLRLTDGRSWKATHPDHEWPGSIPLLSRRVRDEELETRSAAAAVWIAEYEDYLRVREKHAGYVTMAWWQNGSLLAKELDQVRRDVTKAMESREEIQSRRNEGRAAEREKDAIDGSRYETAKRAAEEALAGREDAATALDSIEAYKRTFTEVSARTERLQELEELKRQLQDWPQSPRHGERFARRDEHIPISALGPGISYTTHGKAETWPDGQVVRKVDFSTIYIEEKPWPEDVHQGNLGNCFFLSSLIALAGTNALHVLQNLIQYNSQSRVATVYLHHSEDQGKTWPHKVAICVNTDLVVRNDGELLGAQLRRSDTPSRYEIDGDGKETVCHEYYPTALWAPLVEKAYAVFAETYGIKGVAKGEIPEESSGYDQINQGAMPEYVYGMVYGARLRSARKFFNLVSVGDAITQKYPGKAIEKLLHSQGRKLGQERVAHLTASTSIVRMTRTVELLIKRTLEGDACKGPQKRALEAIYMSCTNNAAYLAGPDALRALKDILHILPTHGDQHLIMLREHIDAFCLAHPYRAHVTQPTLWTGHEYAVMGVRLVDREGAPMDDLAHASPDEFARRLPEIDAARSSVALVNPHRTNIPSFARADESFAGKFTLTLDQFFRHYDAIDIGIAERIG